VRKGDVVALSTKAKSMIAVRSNLDTLDRALVAWLDGGDNGTQVTVRDMPLRAQIDVPVREQLIVELYSK
jgi:small subunit ribosomal protein S4